MKSEIKEEQKVTIKLEDVDEAECISQVARATQAKIVPPTLKEMTDDPIAFRRYVVYLANNTPRAPPDLYGDAFRQWKYRQLLTATLSHLLSAFKHTNDPKQNAWEYYQNWLIVNNKDYKESPFMSFMSAKGLFVHEREGRRKCENVAAGLSEKATRTRGRV